MSVRQPTQGERLARMEALLETKLDAIVDRLEKIEAHQRRQDVDAAADLRVIRTELEQLKTEQATLKGKGAGFLAGAALAGGAIATGLAKLFGG